MRKERAFSLIELLVAVAVSALLISIGIPAFADLIRDHHLVSLNNELNAALQRARTEALKHRQHVVVCKSANGHQCATTGTWDQGWIVFHDADQDRQCNDPDGNGICTDGGRIVLQRQAVGRAGLTINGGSGNTGKRVAFTERGFAPGYAGTFSFCDGRGAAAARGLVISMIGRIRQAKPGDNIGCPE